MKRKEKIKTIASIMEGKLIQEGSRECSDFYRDQQQMEIFLIKLTNQIGELSETIYVCGSLKQVKVFSFVKDYGNNFYGIYQISE